MGHSIQHYKFDENTCKEEIERIVNEDSIYGSDTRKGLRSKVRFLNYKVYENEEKAHEAIDENDDGWYDQLAVKFNHYEPRKETKAITNLRDRIKKTENSLIEYRETHSIKNRKSMFVGCPKCESRINKNYISDSSWRWNTCPLCEEELSSKTVLETVEKRIDTIGELRKRLVRDIHKNNSKGKPVVKWLVKTEYHT